MESRTYLCSFNTPYIPKDKERNYRTFKYSGSDSSISYIWIMSPLAAFLVEYLPKWVAPNLITFYGFQFVLIPHIFIFFFFGTDFSGVIPGWVIFSVGALYFAYQCLDNMDGKQARRTKTSSPLGMAFDHGIDSFVSWIMCMTLAKIIQIGTNLYIPVIISMVTGSFYLATLETLYVGGLHLGIINGVSDGALAIFAILSMTAYSGNVWWTIVESNGMTRSEILIYILAIAQLFVVFGNIVKILTKSE
jgi:ethanolaminephosphotransferase